MRRIILVLCVLLAFGVTLAGTEEMVSKEKPAPQPADPAAAKAAAEPEKSADPEAETEAEACRESFNTLEDIYGADKEALAAHLAALKKAEAAKAEPAAAVEWKEIPEDKPER